VRLKDVARLEVGTAPAVLGRWRGKVAAALALDGTGDPGRVLEDVRDRLPALRKRLPPGTELNLLPGPSLPGTEALIVEGRLPAAASDQRALRAASQVAEALEALPDPKAKT